MLRIRYSFKKCVYICSFIDSVIYSIGEEGDIKPLFKIAYSKPNKRFVAKSVKEEKNYDHVKFILKKILTRVNCGKNSNRRIGMKRQLSLKIAPKERPSREDIIDSSIKYKRIKL